MYIRTEDLFVTFATRVQLFVFLPVFSNENGDNDGINITLTERKVDPLVCIGVKNVYKQYLASNFGGNKQIVKKSISCLL